ncbi:aldo/keto reductase [Amycolatopsis sp. Hca4]|uniref:aldo/keto reductase n=1 Tax=Amycolatopsis sp. Hca4 TaxID=2742131 RepID=UPI0020CAA2E4|nr:aldo/keto reductase [Amycolatopsis sp. Hca4]
MSPRRSVALPSGELVPALGQGTWGWAEHPDSRADEMAALRLGLDLGMTLVDTAEMYADGGSEELVGEAIAGRRDEVFLVDKVLPGNADRQGTLDACRRSLGRLRTDRIDLYLLHWRGRVPLGETVAAFDELVRGGQIRHWGVSNFDTRDLADLAAVAGGGDVATDQILYNLQRRGPEFDLIPHCRQRGLPVMAYSPVEQGRLLEHPALAEVASRHGITPARAALAWVLRSDGMIAIPRAGSPEHVRDNAAALEVQLDEDDVRLLDQAFPPPRTRRALEVL